MSLRHLHLVFICLLMLGGMMVSRGGMTSYTDKGKADFDTFLQLLNPYGKWSKIDGKWAFTPDDHRAPYTDGRWLYTEFGWYWKGRLPHSWATEHYGYWKCSPDKVWSWYPGAYWLPEIVEIRATKTYIGWRSGEVDDEGNFVEAPLDRYSKPAEWTFVTLAQFANPITPGIVASTDVARDQLDDTVDSRHSYMTYRPIDRPGPHPADFVALSKDGGMLAPITLRDQAEAQAQAKLPPAPVPTGTVASVPTGTGAPVPTGTASPAANMTGVTQPALVGTDEDADPAVDTRKVKYWVTMSLPSYWAQPPAEAKPEEIYIYRPDIYQDEDGIQRRIALWFNPKQRTSLKEVFGDNSPTAAPAAGPDTPATPAVPATPVQSRASDPFRSPLDAPFHPSASSHANSASSKGAAPAGTNAVPAGASTTPALPN